MASLSNGDVHSSNPPNGVDASAIEDDPFVGGSSVQMPHPHRYSSFDTMSLHSTSSPSQVKRTLETHLAETERRLQDASKLGTTLVQQRQELADKLKEVERQQDEAEISPELRERLAALEKEYNEVGRESARAILAPKSRVVSVEDRSTGSPAKFESQATASPTKVTVPSRKQRNQQSSRVGDIQFAADISTSLLAQVRQLQGLLAEREETLRAVNLEKSRLELESEGFSQRIRNLDESEQRYKDENWSLLTQTHELTATAKEAAEKEKKLQASLSNALSDKDKTQTSVDDLRVANEKLQDEHTAAQKAHDSELHTLRRNLDVGSSERNALQKKVDDLSSQNQELAKLVSARLRQDQDIPNKDFLLPEEDLSKDLSTPEHSPPPSPSKGTPRHGVLENETLRSSLHHAHRTIQNLKNNIHREKTDKLELKRMLRDAQNELEARRADGNGSGTRPKKTKSETFKKPARPDMLGATRRSRTDVEIDEPEWEDHLGENSPSHNAAASKRARDHSAHVTDASDAYHTANETDAFETANEKDTTTESEAFETGAESLAGDSTDELTETEDRPTRADTLRSKRPSVLALRKPGDRGSYMSTASTSAEEAEDEIATPIQSQPQRYKLKMGRGLLSHRSRNSLDVGSSPANARNSPASFTSNRSTPAPESQSLFAELGDLNDGSDGEYSTPARSSIFSRKSTPARPDTSRRSLAGSDLTSPSETVMVDSGTMTEPWEPDTSARNSYLPQPSDFPLPPSHPGSPYVLDPHAQQTPQKGYQESPLRQMSSFITPPKTIWDEEADLQGDQRSSPHPAPQLTLSHVASENIQPQSPEPLKPQPPRLGRSQLSFQNTTPQIIESTKVPSRLTISRMSSQYTEPLAAKEVIVPEARAPVTLAFSGIVAQETMPVSPVIERPQTATKSTAAGLFGSVGAALGLAKANEAKQPTVAEDEAKSSEERGPTFSNKDQGCQTILSSDQIDHALMQRPIKPVAVSPPKASSSNSASPAPFAPIPLSPRSSSRTRPRSAEDFTANTPYPKRPGSSASQRSVPASHPPLPPDHKRVIAAATKSPTSPAKTVMGPPLTPASAYKRPQTPVDKVMGSPTRDGTTPRARGRQNSQMSRRSSVTSFASELDERFNIRADAFPGAHTFEPGTDARMIQAITQTMIGEFLWKYTRKAGRGEMSNTRHRRYFWVHPYTRTLYWSDQDPQSAGKSELKAKSVPIEAIRVVSDDNPMPPGLHRKSIEIVTPSRKVRFTAPTGQRHDTWLNSLSYLLLRTQEGNDTVNATMDPNNITSDDVAEFNPRSHYRSSQASRASLSTYNSRASANTTIRASSRLSLRQPSTTHGIGASSSSRPNSSNEPVHPDGLIQGSISRLSNYFKPGTLRGSVASASRRGRTDSRHLSVRDGSIYNASVVDESGKDSAEEARQEALRAEKESAGLEDVRACCDGMFNHLLSL